MATLHVDSLSCGYGARVVLREVSFTLSTGETLCLLGPNGAGKTTLFKTMLGLLRPLAGRMLVDGEDTAGWRRQRFAQAIAYIPQDHAPAFPFLAFEVVLMGRTPKLGALSSIGAQDEAVALGVMTSLGIEHLAGRDYTQLSGGERQMVLVARALAQEPSFLAMDEPTASLDLGNQARVLSRIRSLAREGLGIIMTTHDPNQAFLLGGKVACIGHDGSFTMGEVREVLTPGLLRTLYGVEVGFSTLITASARTIPVCAPLLEDA
ncbi:MAG: ABC transporter ATP-binding protein [Coriobacteriales bacterium]|jgi:iron complex transport system ATP-binding protein|nr:ABC transporter ATP-binding protein [Coriobacteriales bacterium]